MAHNPVYNAEIKSNGKKIQVYQLRDLQWCDWSDCTTKYPKDSIKIISQINK